MMKPFLCLTATCLTLASLIAPTKLTAMAAPGRPQLTASLPQTPVALQPGMNLEQALAAVHQATGAVVVAEQPAPAFQLDRTAHVLPLQEALGLIAQAGDFVCICRGPEICFQRRYRSAPDHGLSVPELVRIADQISRLVERHWVQGRAIRGPVAQSPSQQRLRMSNGIPLDLLVSESTRGADMLDHWQEATLEPLGDQFLLRTPAAPHTPQGSAVLLPSLPKAPLDLRRSTRAEEADVVRYQGLPPMPTGFRVPIQVFHGVTTIGVVEKAVKEYANTTLVSPTIPPARKLLVYARNATAAEVVGAIQGLYGWELAKTREGVYYFGYPRFGPSPQADEALSRVVASVPPALANAWDLGASSYAAVRNYERIRILRPYLERHRPPHKVRDLPLREQRLLAAWVVERQLGAAIRPLLVRKVRR